MASRAIVEASLCTGCGLCASICPDVFEVKDDNVAHVKNAEGSNCDLDDVASQCPVEAIKVE